MHLLAEIRAAFPALPYPGDKVLSDCWCEECAWSVRNLRGKSWKQTRVADFNSSDGGHLSREAFRYYLPAMLTFAVQQPDEVHFAGEINARFVAITGAPNDRIEDIQKTVARLSKPQRVMLVHFFEWLRGQGWQAPIVVDAAIKAGSDDCVEPIPADAIWEHVRIQEAKREQP